jgi:hypothetical protein
MGSFLKKLPNKEVIPMAIMKINFSQLDTKKINGMGKFVTSLILLSNEKGIKC